MKKEKIQSDWELESNLELSEMTESFDTASQDVLKNVKVLAYILKYVTSEFKDMNLEQICSCIEVSESDREISPGRTNMVKLEHSEFKISGEKTSVFDIYAKVRNPKLSHGTVKVYLHIDVEPQINYKPREKEESKEVLAMKGFGWAVYNDGREDGRIEGKMEGRLEERTSIIKSMHKKGMMLEQIAEFVEISVEEVEKILKN